MMTDREEVHRRVCASRGQRGELDYEQGVWLLAAYRLAIHESLGLASFAEYAERFGGVDARQARERVRVAEALESLPELAAALKSAELSWSAVRELTRVAIEENESEWLKAARGRTVREIERMVARQRKGDGPFDPAKAEPPRRLPYMVVAPTWALLQEARKKMIAERGASVTDDDFVATLARTFLAGAAKGDDGTAAFSIAITTCDTCRAATQQAGPDQVVIDAPTLERARCDCEQLGRVDSLNPPKVTREIPPRIRRAVIRRHGGRCAVPGCCNTVFLELHHGRPRKDGGTHDPDLLLPLCGQHHQAAHEGTLVIGGSWSIGFTFHHADGSPYGAAGASPALAATFAKVFEALVAMGFADREAHAMIDRARPHVGHDASTHEALRAALKQAVVPGCTTAHAAPEGKATHGGREPAEGATTHAAPEGRATDVDRERAGSPTMLAAAVGREPAESATTHLGREPANSATKPAPAADATTHVGREQAGSATTRVAGMGPEPAGSATKPPAPKGSATHGGRGPAGSPSRAARMSTSEPVELAGSAPDPGGASRSAALASTTAKVFEALVAMGYERREARAMIERATPLVGPAPTAEEALRAALRHARLRSGIGAVRESCAEYARLAA